MQRRQRADLVGENRPALSARLVGERRIPEDPAFFHRHDVERRTDDTIVGTKRIGPGNWKALLAECRDHPEFTIDRMRRRQQFAERLAPHHVGTTRRIKSIGRIRLTALELQDAQWTPIGLHVFPHPAIEARFIDPMALLDRLGARKIVISPDALDHRDAPRLLGSATNGTPVSELRENWHTSEARVWQWRGYGPRPDHPPGAWCASRHSRAPDRHRRRRRPHRRPESRDR